MSKQKSYLLFLLVSFLGAIVGSKGAIWEYNKSVLAKTNIQDCLLIQISNISTEKQNLILDNLIKNMVLVEGGTFIMGEFSKYEKGLFRKEGIDPDNFDPLETENEFDYIPAHPVTLNSYYINKYEVTQEEWQVVMGSNPSKMDVGSKHPIEHVSWNDCQKFIKKLNSLTGKNFRLPTEAEWEFAARGGNKSKGFTFSGGNNLADVGWYSDNSGRTTHDVGKKRPNELGLYDMSGNVAEWCQDWYGKYSDIKQHNPKGVTKGTLRVIRGGHCRVDPFNEDNIIWDDEGNSDDDCRIISRSCDAPEKQNTWNVTGLRLVCSHI